MSSNRTEIKTEDNFAEVKEAVTQAGRDALHDAAQDGARAAQSAIDSGAAAHGYNIEANIEFKSYKRSAKFYVKSAKSEKWGTDSFFMRFFEYGSGVGTHGGHVPAIPFMRPGARIAIKRFNREMDYFDGTIKAKMKMKGK